MTAITTTHASRPGFFARLFTRKRPPSLTPGHRPLVETDTLVAKGFLPAGCSNATVTPEQFAECLELSPDSVPGILAGLSYSDAERIPVSALAAYAASKRGDATVSVEHLHESARSQAAEIVRLCAIWHREKLPPEEIVACVLNRVVNPSN